jgi:hypothetical protein
MSSFQHPFAAAALLLTVQESGCWPSGPSDPLRDLSAVRIEAPRTTLAVGDSMLVQAHGVRSDGGVLVRRIAAPEIQVRGVALAPGRGTALLWVRAVAPGPGVVAAAFRGLADSVTVTVVPARAPAASIPGAG